MWRKKKATVVWRLCLWYTFASKSTGILSFYTGDFLYGYEQTACDTTYIFVWHSMNYLQEMSNSWPSLKSSQLASRKTKGCSAGYRPVHVEWRDLDKCNVCHMDEVVLYSSLKELSVKLGLGMPFFPSCDVWFIPGNWYWKWNDFRWLEWFYMKPLLESNSRINSHSH